MFERIDVLLMLIPGLPLLAAIVTALLGPRVLRSMSHVPVVVAFAVSFLCSLLLVFEVRDQQSPPELEGQVISTRTIGYEHLTRLWTWASIDGAYESDAVGTATDAPDFRIDITLRADALTAMMLAMVTFISSLVAIFGSGYMDGDRGYWRFFTYVALFVFSMTMLVSVSNFVLLFVFWEAVGACSYLLIGFWYEKPEAAAAGKKAFLVNRIGDFAFTIALFLIWTTYGSLNYHDTLKDGRYQSDVVSQAIESGRQDVVVPGVLGQTRIAANDYVIGEHGQVTVTAICILLMLGACGKSAQFPLHVWLPDAMEGPTPVSALIHAATMVTAGVYMVARCTPLFMSSPPAQMLVAVIGGFTALLAALIALTQFDLKRVLAYSTISQLGYMFLALGAGTLAGITGGMFHLFTHAFFKALLFLGAGSVMHAMGHIIDMRRFSGLRRLMPHTHWTFLFGCLALAGVAPFAGFWSKDAVLAAVETKAHALEHEIAIRHGDGGHATSHGTSEAHVPAYLSPAEYDHLKAGLYSGLSDAELHRNALLYKSLYILGLVVAFLTAFYTFRAFFMTFYGEERVPHEAEHHAHESPGNMVVPLGVLAFCALLVGLYFDRTPADGGHAFAEFLEHTPSLAGGLVVATAAPHEFHLSVAATSTFVAIGGILVALYLYLGDRREVDWLKYLLNLEWLGRVTDVESASRLRQLPWVAGVYRVAKSVRLGWLASLIGQVLLLVVLILTAPILLGLFLTPYRLSVRKFYFDEIYNLLVVVPLRFGARVLYAIDRWLIDGVVNLCGRLPVAFGGLMRSLQMGLVQFYALSMMLGVLVLLLVKVLWMN
ncbi:MAG: NADH-quinone oxidoreductase subunit L [Planctomycetales bacterium]|nr:NADH-quinone oxidoreductase subunit L [Planctomycetales bacterium]